MCETPLETRFMLAETEMRARALAGVSREAGTGIAAAFARAKNGIENWMAGATSTAPQPAKEVR